MQPMEKYSNEAMKKINEAVDAVVKFADKYKAGYEAWYRKMVATRKFFDAPSWDHLQRTLESMEEGWLKDLRSDDNFKEYYKLRAEYDRLEVLLK